MSMGTGRYVNGLKRLGAKCKEGGVDCILHRDMPANAPSHGIDPYGFKLTIIEDARRRGYQKVIWMDTSVYFEGGKVPPQVERLLEEEGVAMFHEGFWSDQWCNDACLYYFGVSREEAAAIRHGAGKVVGFNFGTKEGREFFEQWREALACGAFRGSWKDHRHDQSCLGLIAARCGVDLVALGDVKEIIVDGSCNR